MAANLAQLKQLLGSRVVQASNGGSLQQVYGTLIEHADRDLRDSIFKAGTAFSSLERYQTQLKGVSRTAAGIKEPLHVKYHSQARQRGARWAGLGSVRRGSLEAAGERSAGGKEPGQAADMTRLSA